MKKYLPTGLYIFLAITVLQQTAGAQPYPGGINAGLKVWLKADAGTSSTLNGTAISAWNDQSGNSRHHTQTNAVKQPMYIGAGGSFLMNYNPAVRFSGIGDNNVNNDFLQVNNYLLPTDAFHVFTVSHTGGSNGTPWNTVYGFSADISHTDWYNQKVSCRTNGAEKTNTSNTITYGLSSGLMPKTGNQRVIWNGTVQSFSNNGYNITVAASPTFTVGVDRNNTNPMIGDIQEVIVYAGAGGIDMTADQINRIQSYLALKYGIALDPAGQADYTSGTGTTTWTGTDNTGYQRNIFGLGRDDASALYQKQAFSYGDSSITVYLGSALADLNNLNTATIATDNSFLILGGNGMAGYNSSINYLSGTAFVNGVIASDLNALSNRVWKAQTTTQTSWVVNINANKFKTATYLLVSSSTAFANATTRIYPVTAGTVSDVTINNGEYLAFATFASGPGGIGSNLAVWLRADAGTSTQVNDGAISDWADQSGKNRTHSQTNVANQPKFVGEGGSILMNYNPGVRFDGSNDFMSVPKYNIATDAVHLFAVSRLNAANIGTWTCLYAQQTAILNQTWYPQNGFICPSSYINSNHLNTSKAGINYGLTSYISPRTGTQRMIWNGNAAAIGSTTYNPANFTANYRLGEDADGTDPFQGVIQEVVIYADPAGGDMTTNQIERVQSYLAIKYGISLDSVGQPDYTAGDNATLFWTGASNTGYRNNIFGLGRDDNSNLLQTQAFSYGDSSLSLFLGPTLAPLNTLNNTTITANLSFLMLGDNNQNGNIGYGPYSVGTAFSNINLPTQLNYRSNRIWKTQATTQTSWLVNINPNKFGTGANAASNAVLVCPAADFDPASTRVYPVVNGTATDVLVNNGDYVAIASLILAPGGVGEKLALWVKSDDAGAAPSAAWKDNSFTSNPVEAIGTMNLSAADANHNYYPFYTGFTAANHFYDANATMQPDNNYGNFTRTSHAMFSAVRPASQGTGRIVGIDNDNTFAAEPGYSLRTGNPYFYNFFEGANSYQYTSKVVSGQSSIIAYVADQAANAGNGTLKIGLNGADQLFNMPAGNFFHVIGQRLRIGYGDFDLAGPFPGDIMEIAWYKKALTANEAGRVSSYLALKNGVTLGSNAAPVDYLNTASQTIWTGSPTFQNNMNGIGRDDAEAFYQKQGHSINVNTNGQLIISLGAPAVSNAANTGIFSNDIAYQVWGDNNVNTSLATASTAFSYNNSETNLRMNRIWRTQNTGLSDPLQIIIPQTMIGTITINDCQKLVLVVAADEAFTNILTTANLAISDANYIATYKFPAGVSYFTFARLEKKAEGIVDLPYATTASQSYNTCEEPGWRYFYSDGTPGLNDGTKKIFAINRNGNGTINTLDNFTGTIAYMQGGIELTEGLKTSRIMARMLTVNDPAAGTYTVNGGMKLRFYIDSSELKSTILDAARSATWFKHPGDATSTIADQTTATITNAVFYDYPASGTEDGVNYVEFSNITGFSTFGFVSNSGNVGALPVVIKSFAVSKVQNTVAHLSWQVGTEENVRSYEIQRSNDGVNFYTIATIPAIGNSTYNYDDSKPHNGNNFYKIKMVDIDDQYAYSEIKSISFSSITGNVVIYPNPVENGAAITIQLNGYAKGAACRLYNNYGQLIQSYTFKQGSNNISTQNIAATGIYVLKIINNATGEMTSHEIIMR